MDDLSVESRCDEFFFNQLVRSLFVRVWRQQLASRASITTLNGGVDTSHCDAHCRR